MELRYAPAVERTVDCQLDVLSPNNLKFHYAVIQFYRTAVCPCCQVPHKTYWRFSYYLFRFYISSVGYSVSKVWNYGHFFWGGGFCPSHWLHTLPIRKNVLPQLRADWTGSSFNNSVIILKDEEAVSSETSEYLITTGCCNQNDNCDLNKNRRENMKNFLHVCTVQQWRLKHFIIQQMHKYIIRRYN